MTQLAASPSSPAMDDRLTTDEPFTTLDRLPIGQMCTVHDVRAPADAPEWAQWLEEIGFIAGERVTLMARGMPGADPLVVRVGLSTFALRRAEAACIHVTKDEGNRQ